MEFLEKVEQSGKWPRQASTTMFFFLVTKHVTCGRPITLLPAMIRWWEGLRAKGCERKRQQRHRVEWDAIDGRNGGAERIVLVTLLEMKRFVCLAEEEDQGASTVVLDSAKAFEPVSLPVVWTYATHFDFSSQVLRVLRGYFGHQRRFQFEGCVAEPLRTITAIFPGSKWSRLLLRTVVHDAMV